MILLERRHNYVRQPSDIGGVSGSDAFWIEDGGRKYFVYSIVFPPSATGFKRLCAFGLCQ